MKNLKCLPIAASLACVLLISSGCATAPTQSAQALASAHDVSMPHSRSSLTPV